MFAPRIKIVINGKMWEDLQRSVGHGRSYLIQLGVAQNVAGSLQCGLLGQIDLMLLVHHSTPRINLLVNVDLHGAHVGATAIPVSYTHLDVYKRQTPSCIK